MLDISRLRSPKLYFLFALVLVSSLAFVPLFLILKDGINVPFCDEWGLAAFLNSLRKGHLSFEQFWAPNNEHRIFFPKIAFTALTALTRWNSVGIMILSWGIITAVAFFLLYCFTRIYHESKRGWWLAILTLSLLLFFSPIQRQNWLWAFQLSFFFVQAGVIISVFILTFTEIPLPPRLFLVILFAVFASLSAVQGLMIWPVLLITVLLSGDTRSRRILGFIVLFGAAVLVCTVYSLNYKTPSKGHLPLDQLAHNLPQPLFYFISLLGAPMVFWLPDAVRPGWAFFAGGFLLMLFAWFVYLIRQHHLNISASPWIGLACFTLAFCAITTFGRIDLGINTGALQSRYTTHELLFNMAVLVLGYLLLDGRGETLPMLQRFLACTLLFCAALCVFLGYFDGFRQAKLESRPRLLAKRLLPFFQWFDPETDGSVDGPYYALVPIPKLRFYDSIKIYEQLGLIDHVVKDPRFIIPPNGLHGSFSITQNNAAPNNIVSVSGTLRTPSDFSPDFAFIREAGDDHFIAAAPLKRDNGFEGETTYEWKLKLSTPPLSMRSCTLEVWTYDKSANTFLMVDQSPALQ